MPNVASIPILKMKKDWETREEDDTRNLNMKLVCHIKFKFRNYSALRAFIWSAILVCPIYSAFIISPT